MSWPGQPNPCFQSRTFLLELRREPAVRNDQITLAANQQNRRIAAEAGQVTDVRWSHSPAAHQSRHAFECRSELLAAGIESIHECALGIPRKNRITVATPLRPILTPAVADPWFPFQIEKHRIEIPPLGPGAFNIRRAASSRHDVGDSKIAATTAAAILLPFYFCFSFSPITDQYRRHRCLSRTPSPQRPVHHEFVCSYGCFWQ